MIENYKEILKNGMVIKNYKIMCNLLEENTKFSSSKVAQIKEWKRFFNFDKQGQKFLITEIYKTQLEKQDNRKFGNNTVHGLHKTKLQGVLKGMISRCNHPSNPNYIHYGGRGITICNEWVGRGGIVNFTNWAITNGYRENIGLSIDRINVNGNYEPSNCRWVDDKIQMINRRISKGIILNPNKKLTNKDYIIQCIDGIYLTYLIYKNRTYPVGTYLSEESSIDSITELYIKLSNL